MTGQTPEAIGPPRTYSNRGGRVGPEIRDILTTRLPDYALPVGPWDLSAVFPDCTALVIEIGSGMGDATFAMAQAQPEVGLVAVEVHERGVGSLIRAADRAGLTNVRVFVGDGLIALRDCVPPASIDGIRVWFPDPWPKNRHHKRRLIQPDNVALMASALRPGGTLHVATDVASYADVIADVLAGAAGLEPVVVRGPRPAWRPWTKYERAGDRAGRSAQDFIYRRVAGSRVVTVGVWDSSTSGLPSPCSCPRH